MALKRCAYKKCFATSEDKSNTFFQFPKEQKRCEMWMKLSATENKSATKQKYLCAKHFDHSKYVACHPRRKLLLAHAIPYAYEDNIIEEYKHDHEEDETSESNFLNEEIEEILLVSDEVSSKRIKICDETDYIFDEVMGQESGDTEANRQVLNIKVSTERKNSENVLLNQQNSEFYENSADYSTSEKRTKRAYSGDHHRKQYSKSKKQTKVFSVIQQQEEEECGENDMSNLVEEIAEDDLLLDNPNITTFIFKNQEYIQMPKADYITEKSELIKKLRCYQNIIKNIKKDLDNL